MAIYAMGSGASRKAIEGRTASAGTGSWGTGAGHRPGWEVTDDLTRRQGPAPITLGSWGPCVVTAPSRSPFLRAAVETAKAGLPLPVPSHLLSAPASPSLGPCVHRSTWHPTYLSDSVLAAAASVASPSAPASPPADACRPSRELHPQGSDLGIGDGQEHSVEERPAQPRHHHEP